MSQFARTWREVAIVAFAEAHVQPAWRDGNDIEILIEPIDAALRQVGLQRQNIDFTTGGSNDFLVGQAFSFVRALDVVGVHPVKDDSHVEMDAAWALYEAWVRLQLGDVDTALVWALGKTSLGNMNELMALAVDPYYMAPLRPDPTALAALQAQALLNAGLTSAGELLALAARRRGCTVEQAAKSAALATPLNSAMVGAPCDGAACIVLAAGEKARQLCQQPAWIRGIDHRADAHALGQRDLTRCMSLRTAAEKIGAVARQVDVAELHAAFVHEEIILRRELELGDAVAINASGGAIAANPVMATGLIRLGKAAESILQGRAKSALAHASHGPCLQHNLLCLLEAA